MARKWQKENMHVATNNILFAAAKRGVGHSRHEAKLNNETYDKIFSWNTFRTYKDNCHHFIDWVQSNHPEAVNLNRAYDHRQEYLEHLAKRGCSASTQKTHMASINKLYAKKEATGQLSGERLHTIENRSRSTITRSRETYDRNERAIDRNSDLVRFCRATGLRRREVEKLKGSSYSDGKVLVQNGKGGKTRYVQPTKGESAFVERVMTNAGDNFVFGKCDKDLDIHALRSEYANALYFENARDVSTLSNDELYYCRNDLVGVVLDRKAMQIVSENLGHNRIEVFAANYYRK